MTLSASAHVRMHSMLSQETTHGTCTSVLRRSNFAERALSRRRPELFRITCAHAGRTLYASWPQFVIVIGLRVLPLSDPSDSNFFTTSMPDFTSPKTTCLPSSQLVTTVVTKNWLPFVPGPALAIDSRPGFVCYGAGRDGKGRGVWSRRDAVTRTSSGCGPTHSVLPHNQPLLPRSPHLEREVLVLRWAIVVEARCNK